jgi:endonuclease YncB( thermonuclease family)
MNVLVSFARCNSSPLCGKATTFQSECSGPAGGFLTSHSRPARQASADTIAGRATVIDGDTLEIHGERIRILDIDAPESRQTCNALSGSGWKCGQWAANKLAEWIGQLTVTCETTRKDRYGRWLARCDVAGVNVANLAGRPRLGCALP